MPTETKEQILDVAERMFAEEGVHGVSLRAIIAEAKVNLAAVHYHFGSKDALVEAVFERRVGPINEARLEWLDRIEAEEEQEAQAVEQKLVRVRQLREADDLVAARKLLYEVLEEGDATQIRVARNILEQMDD